MDNMWDATRRSTPGKSAADQTKRSMLLTRTGVMMARSSEFNSVPRLMEWPSRPTLGSRSSLDRAIPKPGGRSMWLVCWIGSCGRRLAV